MQCQAQHVGKGCWQCAPANARPVGGEAAVLCDLAREEYDGVRVARPHSAHAAVLHRVHDVRLPRQRVDLQRVRPCHHKCGSHRGMQQLPKAANYTKRKVIAVVGGARC